MIRKEWIDERICDGAEGSTNKQTWKEWIREIENEFELENKNLYTMSDKELNEYIDWLDYLCEK